MTACGPVADANLEFSCSGFSHQLVLVLPNYMTRITGGEDIDVNAASFQCQFQLVHLPYVFCSSRFEP